FAHEDLTTGIQYYGSISTIFSNSIPYPGGYESILEFLTKQPGMGFYVFAIVALPIFAFTAKNREWRMISLSIAGFAIFSMSLFLGAGFATLMGNHNLYYSITAVIINLSPIVFAISCALLAVWLKRRDFIFYMAVFSLLLMLKMRFLSGS